MADESIPLGKSAIRLGETKPVVREVELPKRLLDPPSPGAFEEDPTGVEFGEATAADRKRLDILLARQRIRDAKRVLKQRHMRIGLAIGRPSSVEREKQLLRNIRDDMRRLVRLGVRRLPPVPAGVRVRSHRRRKAKP